MASIERRLPDPEATERLGRRLAAVLPPGYVVFLRGDLGAGKTSVARGILRGLGVTGSVKSPTYTLIESYALGEDRWVHHLDLYRLAEPGELEWLGLRELFTDRNLVLIEWPERGEGALPAPDLTLVLTFDNGGRRAVLSGHDDDFLDKLKG